MNIELTHQYLAARLSAYGSIATVLQDRVEQARKDERGLTSTEVAVLTFVLVSIAVALAAVLWQATQSRTDAISNIENPTIGDSLVSEG